MSYLLTIQDPKHLGTSTFIRIATLRSEERHDYTWYIYSGSPKHITMHRKILRDYKEFTTK